MEKACEQNRFKNKQDGKPDMVSAPHMPAYSLHSIYLAFATAIDVHTSCTV